MSKQLLKFNTNDSSPWTQPIFNSAYVSGNVTTAPTLTVLGGGIAPFAGSFDLDDIWMSLATTGADGTDPLTLSMDVKINGTSIFSTLPSIDDAAADGATTRIGSAAAPTGVVRGVLKALASRTFAIGDIITVTFTLTRTTPETEMAGFKAVVGITPLTDFDVDPTVNVT